MFSEEWASARELADTLAELAADYECEWMAKEDVRWEGPSETTSTESEASSSVASEQSEQSSGSMENPQ